MLGVSVENTVEVTIRNGEVSAAGHEKLQQIPEHCNVTSCIS